MAKLLYFAQLVDQLGQSAEQVALPAQVRDVQSLVKWLEGRGTEWRRALAGGKGLRVTVNRAEAGPETAVAQGDEIAFFAERR
jgi:molybdopterin synthase sulfur carrier subunit